MPQKADRMSRMARMARMARTYRVPRILTSASDRVQVVGDQRAGNLRKLQKRLCIDIS